jgi:hypothetical protein
MICFKVKVSYGPVGLSHKKFVTSTSISYLQLIFYVMRSRVRPFSHACPLLTRDSHESKRIVHGLSNDTCRLENNVEEWPENSQPYCEVSKTFLFDCTVRPRRLLNERIEIGRLRIRTCISARFPTPSGFCGIPMPPNKGWRRSQLYSRPGPLLVPTIVTQEQFHSSLNSHTFSTEQRSNHKEALASFSLHSRTIDRQEE